MNSKKILFFVKTLLISAILLFGAAVFTACGDNQGKEFPAITFTSESNGDFGEYYRLEMVVPSGVTIEGVSVKNAMNTQVSLDENYGFTPTAYGLYVYTVNAGYNGQKQAFTFKLSIVDGEVPVIEKAPDNVQVECGLYNGFEDDLGLMEVVCKNQSLASYLTLKAIKIEGEGVEVADENGFASYLFDKAGNYTVTVKAETLNGKSATCTYVITVKDEKAPVISISENVFTWLADGKISLPQPRIYDFSSYEVQTAVEKGGVAQTVTEGKLSAAANDVFNVTYTAKDNSGNQSSATCNIYVLAEGAIVSGDIAAFAAAIKAGDGVAEFINGGLYLQSSVISDEFSFNGAAFAYKTGRTDYASVKFDINNEQSSAVTLDMFAHYGAAKVHAGKVTLSAGANVKYVLVENAEGITGISFKTSSDKRIKLKVNSISFATAIGDGEASDALTPDPVYALDVASNAIYAFKATAGEAYSKKTAAVFGAEASVLYSDIKSGAMNSALFEQSVALSDVNYVEFSIFSGRTASVTLGLIINGGKTVYVNAALVKGVNAVRCFVTTPAITSLDGLSFKNGGAFDLELYVGAINFYNRTSVSAREVFTGSTGDVTLNYGENLVVPEIVNFNLKAISALDITLKKGETVVKSGLSVGETVNVYALDDPEGEYTLVYKATDVFNVSHEKSVSVTASEKEFYAEIKLTEDYYAGDNIELPDPIITGSLYERYASDVKVNKYYRVQGGAQWLNADDGFVIYSNAYVDVKYSVYVDGVVSELAETTFYVHAGGVTFDFERMADGSYLGAGADYDSRYPATISSNWSNDGKYSLYMGSGKYFDIFIGMVFEDGIYLDKTCNAVIFYAYADKDISGDTSIGVLTTDKGWSETNIRIKKGVNKYIVPLPKEFTGFTKFGGQVKRSEPYYIDSVSFDYLYEMEVGEQTGSIISDVEFSLAKPAVKYYSKAAFTEKQIKSANYSVEITDETGETTIYNFTSDELKLTLAKGEYELNYVAEIAGFTFSERSSLLVTDLPTTFFDIQTGFNTGVEYTFRMPEVEGMEADKKLEYRLVGENEWSLADGNKITFEVFGKYELRFTVLSGNKSDEMVYNAVVRDAYTIMDFETDADGNHFGWHNNPYEAIASKTTISDEWSADGKYSLKIEPYMDSWAGVKINGADQAMTLPEECNFIEFYIKTERAISGWEFEVRGGGVTGGGTLNLTAGVNKCVVQFSKPIKTIDTYVIFRIKPDFGTLYVDAVRFYALNVEFPTDIPAEVTVNKAFTVPEITAEGAVTVVKYKNAGEETYTVAEKIAEGYNVTFTTVGTGEIVYEVTLRGVTLSKSYAVEVKGFVVKWKKMQTGVTAGESLTFEKPSNEAGLTYSIMYKLKGATEWTDAAFADSGCTITFTEAGDYVVKLVVDSGDNQAEKEYTVYARPTGTIFDFETDAEGNHYGLSDTLINPTCFEGGVTDEWSANGNYSFMVKPTNNSWAGIDYSANPIVLQQATKKFEMWVNALETVNNWTVEIHDGTGWIATKISLEKGAHKYTFKFDKYIGKIVKVDFRANGAGGTAEFTGTYYVDGLTAVYDELTFPAEQPKNAVIGEATELADFIVPLGATATVKWRMYGEENFTEVTKTDGEYTVNFSKYGTAEVVYEVDYNGEKSSQIYYIYVDEYRFTERY